VRPPLSLFDSDTHISFRLWSSVIQVFETTNNKIRLCHHCSHLAFAGPFYFSADSSLLSLLSKSYRPPEPSTLCQYNAETGEMVNNQPIEDISTGVPYFNSKLNNRFADGVGICAISSHEGQYQRVMYHGDEEICKIPVHLTWEKQAQVGGTHLFLASATYGMIILKAPPTSDSPDRTSDL